jgi:hypothetical protein
MTSPNIIWAIKSTRIRWTGRVTSMGDRTGAYTVLVGKPDRKRPLGRPRHGWEDNIKKDLQEVGCGGTWTGFIWLKIGAGGRH